MPSITDSIGRVLGGRYRLVTALGTGASSHVYLADDVALHRQVAIKALHPGLAGDSAFLKRFRAEAQAVAALNHPSILKVYDWGEEDGVPYLVLEFLAGGSLRQVYDTGALLSPAQAAQIGIEAAAGLDYAHRRGLIHRDIKPANLLFDADGRLRIADFGLARALAEASWTEPDGAILGTARYSAPEQVEGWVLDGKADVYALALVLYEGVTGESPFIGDTTVATLMARVGALLPEHKALGPLNEILVWAAAPEPSERYDAAQLGAKLEALAATLPAPQPLPTTGVEGDELHPGRVYRDVDLTELGAPGPEDKPSKSTKHLPTSKDSKRIRSRRTRRLRMAGALLVVAALLVGAGFLLVRSGLLTPSRHVPSIVGKTVAQADATQGMQTGHFVVRITQHSFNDTVASGVILSQHPTPVVKGKSVTLKQGSTIDVIVSAGPPPVPFPTMTKVASCTLAVALLKSEHLVGVCPASAVQYSSTVPAGAVIGTSPSGTARYGSTVVIGISKGHAPVVVPAVTASTYTYTSAAAALTAAGFVPSEVRDYSSTVPSGQIISTSPTAAAGPQPFGSPVAVDVSIGPMPVTIPGLRGDPINVAIHALEALGLHVAGPYGPRHATTAVSTDPAAGSSVPIGSTVDLYSR